MDKVLVGGISAIVVVVTIATFFLARTQTQSLRTQVVTQSKPATFSCQCKCLQQGRLLCPTTWSLTGTCQEPTMTVTQDQNRQPIGAATDCSQLEGTACQGYDGTTNQPVSGTYSFRGCTGPTAL